MPSQVWWAQPPATGRKFRAGGGWLKFFFLKRSQSRHRLPVALLGTNCLPSRFMLNVRHGRLSDLTCTDWNTMSQLACRAAGFLPEMIATVACVCSISVPQHGWRAWPCPRGPSEFVSDTFALLSTEMRFFILSFSKWTTDPFLMLRSDLWYSLLLIEC